MKINLGKLVVIALGGSVMYPDQIDSGFLKLVKALILKNVKQEKRFVIVSGGGRVSRVYQEAASKITRVNDEDKDWLGIHATRVNAHLLRTIFREVADPIVMDSRGKIKEIKYPVTIVSGWRPGWSTDYVSIACAADFGASHVVIAGKPSHVFDKDFVKHADAKPFVSLTWREYRRLIPSKWRPGFHSPVDPIGARLAEKESISAVIINGKDLKNFGNLLNGKEFIGTVIS